ncbi:hypothetical protein LTR66_017186 [Elasticomyces elasticus]|nr:hypothetical protein LTR66_017186 [Elasticomyces elasticus]
MVQDEGPRPGEAQANHIYKDIYNRSVDNNANIADPKHDPNIHDAYSNKTEVGRWLRWRDGQVRDGRWNTPLDETSIFYHLNSLYPYQSEQGPTARERLDAELDQNFHNVRLPDPKTPHLQNERAFRSVLVVMKQRGDIKSADQKRVLLDLLSSTEVQSRQAVHAKKGTINDAAREVEALSDQNQKHTDNAADFVRAQRLAFFAKKATPTHEQIRAELMDANKPTTRRDSALSDAGSLTGLNATFSLDHNDDHSEGCLADPNNPAKAEEGEVIPNTLDPAGWHEHIRSERWNDPRIMPIPRTMGFEFDARQMADIELIRAGGNGCARVGNEFVMERESYRWIGGGSMAREQVDGKQKKAKQGAKQEHMGAATGGERLAGELPGYVEL